MSTVISPPATAQAPQSRHVVMSTAATVAATSARKAAPGGRVAAKHVVPVSAVLAENPAVQPAEAVAGMWREVQGAGDWAGMMEPLHPVLRSEVVRYGELVAAAYKAFDVNPASARYLKCKHGRRAMLREAGMGCAGYDVTRYVYATPDGDRAESRWIGYVAVADDEAARQLGRRDIVVAFRGTATAPEWAANLRSTLAAARFDAADPRPDVKVESGFLSLYTSDDATAKFTCGSCRNQLLAEVARLVGKHKHEDVSITMAGHSMGSSLAILLAYDLAELGLNRVAIDASASSGNGKTKTPPITVYSFAGPRVGNAAFKDRCDELGIKVLRVVNVNDPITKLPGVFLNESSLALAGGRLELPWSCACYTHVGVELAIDFFEARDPACVHDLEVYIGLLKEPKAASMGRRREKGMVSKAKQFVLERNFDTWRWQMAAVQVGGLVCTDSRNVDICRQGRSHRIDLIKLQPILDPP